MTDERKTPRTSKTSLLLLTAAALIGASAIFVLFVLPAEFHRDPTGFGRLTGLDQLAGPEVITVAAAPAGPNSTVRNYASAYRSDVVDITLPPDEKNELEYKVKMKTGDADLFLVGRRRRQFHPSGLRRLHGESFPNPPGPSPR
jgi:hypothetical protein